MFPGMSPFNQLQSFTQGTGGVNPIISQLLGSQTAHPLLASLLTQQGVGQGWGQIANPLAVAQIAASYPALLPLIAHQAGYGQVPYGIQSLLQPQQGLMGSPFQQLGAGFGQQTAPLATILSLLGQQGYGPQIGGVGQQVHPLLTILSLAAQQRGQQGFGQQYGGFGQQTTPLSVILSLMGQQGGYPSLGQPTADPFTMAHQLSQWSQSQLPIRPLVSPQQYDPFQASSLMSLICGQTIDPYTALAQACSPLAVSPIHQAMRAHAVSPLTVSAVIPALASPIASVASPIASVASPIASLASPIASLTSPIASLTSPIASLASPIASLASPIASLTSPIAPLASPIASLATPIAPLASLITPLASPIAPMMQSVTQPYVC